MNGNCFSDFEVEGIDISAFQRLHYTTGSPDWTRQYYKRETNQFE